MPRRRIGGMEVLKYDANWIRLAQDVTVVGSCAYGNEPDVLCID